MPFLTTTQIHVEMHWDELRKTTERAINKALVEWAAIALEEIRSAETRIGTASPTRAISPGVHLHDSFQVTIIPRLRGFGINSADVVVWTSNPNAIWQELGTRARRRKKLKSGESPYTKRRETTSGNRGVTPLYFMRTGARRSFPAGLELIRNALGSMGSIGGSGSSFDTVSPNFFKG